MLHRQTSRITNSRKVACTAAQHLTWHCCSPQNTSTRRPAPVVLARNSIQINDCRTMVVLILRRIWGFFYIESLQICVRRRRHNYRTLLSFSVSLPFSPDTFTSTTGMSCSGGRHRRRLFSWRCQRAVDRRSQLEQRLLPSRITVRSSPALPRSPATSSTTGQRWPSPLSSAIVLKRQSSCMFLSFCSLVQMDLFVILFVLDLYVTLWTVYYVAH